MPAYPAQSVCGGETSERERRSGRERVEFVLRVRVVAMMHRGAQRRSALARSCRAPTGSDKSCVDNRGASPILGLPYDMTIHSPAIHTPSRSSASLWSDPVGARQLRIQALRRRAPPMDACVADQRWEKKGGAE